LDDALNLGLTVAWELMAKNTPCLQTMTRHMYRTQHGGVLVEVVISVLLFAMVGSAVLGGVSMTQTSGARVKVQSTAENLGRNQMEYVFALPYQAPPSTYPTIETPPTYALSALAETYVAGDPNIEKVVVTVFQEGQEVLALEAIRIND
jgi:Tfp pilus assembly protein PilV